MTMNEARVDVENGKYTYVIDDAGRVTVLRFGKPWLSHENVPGGRALGVLIHEIAEGAEKVSSNIMPLPTQITDEQAREIYERYYELIFERSSQWQDIRDAINDVLRNQQQPPIAAPLPARITDEQARGIWARFYELKERPQASDCQNMRDAINDFLLGQQRPPIGEPEPNNAAVLERVDAADMTIDDVKCAVRLYRAGKSSQPISVAAPRAFEVTDELWKLAAQAYGDCPVRAMPLKRALEAVSAELGERHAQERAKGEWTLADYDAAERAVRAVGAGAIMPLSRIRELAVAAVDSIKHRLQPQQPEGALLSLTEHDWNGIAEAAARHSSAGSWTGGNSHYWGVRQWLKTERGIDDTWDTRQKLRAGGHEREDYAYVRTALNAAGEPGRAAKAFVLTDVEKGCVEYWRGRVGSHWREGDIKHLIGAVDRALATVGPTEREKELELQVEAVEEVRLHEFERAEKAEAELADLRAKSAEMERALVDARCAGDYGLRRVTELETELKDEKEYSAKLKKDLDEMADWRLGVLGEHRKRIDVLETGLAQAKEREKELEHQLNHYRAECYSADDLECAVRAANAALEAELAQLRAKLAEYERAANELTCERQKLADREEHRDRLIARVSQLKRENEGWNIEQTRLRCELDRLRDKLAECERATEPEQQRTDMLSALQKWWETHALALAMTSKSVYKAIGVAICALEQGKPFPSVIVQAAPLSEMQRRLLEGLSRDLGESGDAVGQLAIDTLLFRFPKLAQDASVDPVDALIEKWRSHGELMPEDSWKDAADQLESALRAQKEQK